MEKSHNDKYAGRTGLHVLYWLILALFIALMSYIFLTQFEHVLDTVSRLKHTVFAPANTEVTTLATQEPETVDSLGSINVSVIDMKEVIDLPGISYVGLDPWSADGSSFSFTNYYESNSEEPCDMLSFECVLYYVYDLTDEVYSASDYIPPHRLEWLDSPNGTYSVKVEMDGIALMLRTNATDEERTLALQDEPMELRSPAWSPDEQWLAMYDYTDWNEEGVRVIVVPVNAADLSEATYLGRTMLVETERMDERAFDWSPDSTMFFAMDSYPIFSITEKKELFRPSDKRWTVGLGAWRWSPDSTKLLGIKLWNDESIGSQDEGYELYTFKPDGSDLSLYQEGIGAADWLADNKYVVYSLLNVVYLLDIETNKQVLLYDGDEEASFVSLHVSPDQNHILLVQGSGNFSQTIWLMTIGMQ